MSRLKQDGFKFVPTSACRYELTPHTKPRLSAFVDKEQQHANVQITFNHPRGQISTPGAFVSFLQDGMFQAAVNNRFYKLCRKPDPPFWAAQARPHLLHCIALHASSPIYRLLFSMSLTSCIGSLSFLFWLFCVCCVASCYQQLLSCVAFCMIDTFLLPQMPATAGRCKVQIWGLCLGCLGRPSV